MLSSPDRLTSDLEISMRFAPSRARELAIASPMPIEAPVCELCQIRCRDLEELSYDTDFRTSSTFLLRTFMLWIMRMRRKSPFLRLASGRRIIHIFDSSQRIAGACCEPVQSLTSAEVSSARRFDCPNSIFTAD